MIELSRPPFSRKRKGKTVDPYPLKSKEKSKSSRTKKNAGRPRKAKGERPSLKEKPRRKISDDVVYVSGYHEVLYIRESDGTVHEPEADTVIFKNCDSVKVDLEEGTVEAKFKRAKVTGKKVVSHTRGTWPYYDCIIIEPIEGE